MKISIFGCPGNPDLFQYLSVQATQIRAPKYIVDAASVRLYQDGTIKWVKSSKLNDVDRTFAAKSIKLMVILISSVLVL